MLIKCPECSKEFSDKAKCCPNCGCPVEAINTKPNFCKINNINYDFNDIIEILPQVGEKPTDVSPIYITGVISRKTQLEWDYAQQLASIIIETKTIPLSFDGVLKKRTGTPQPNIPKCPICGSTNLSKITNTKKVAKILAFGVFGMGDNGKTFKCNNCGSKF